jgi:hypothetical protein
MSTLLHEGEGREARNESLGLTLIVVAMLHFLELMFHQQ